MLSMNDIRNSLAENAVQEDGALGSQADLIKMLQSDLRMGESPELAVGRFSTTLSCGGSYGRLDTLDQARIDDAIIQVAQNDSTFLRGLLAALPIPTELPLVRRVITRIDERKPWRNLVVAANQHLLGSIVPQFMGLMELGVERENLVVMGKPYSLNRAALLYLRHLGIDVDDTILQTSADRFLAPTDYDLLMDTAAQSVLDRAIERMDSLGESSRLLILDDGGVLIAAAHQRLHSTHCDRTAAVEQTTGGIQRVSQFGELRFPVISVAGSYAKLQFESPFIGKSIVDELGVRLKRLGTDLSCAHVLIIGLGAVGRAVRQALLELHNRVSISVYDYDYAKTVDVKKALSGINHNLSDYDIIIGCTGRNCLRNGSIYHLKDGAILVSGSSANVEFGDIWRHMNKGPLWGMVTIDHATWFERVHGDYEIRVEGRKIWLVNAGFPVNFPGSIDPIAPNRIELTRALMIAGSYQAVSRLGAAPSIEKLSGQLSEMIVASRGAGSTRVSRARGR
jgi:hypothetical protein